MGITIYYSGKIKDINLIPEMIDGIKNISKIAGWKYTIIDSQPRIYGIALDIHPKCETVLITFDKEGALGYIYEHKDKDGKTKSVEAHSLSVKTQYAGEKTHIAVIELFKYLKNKYMPILDVEDEGGYWDKEDPESLKMSFARSRMAIDGLGNALEDYTAGRRVDPSYAQVIQAIERHEKEGEHAECDITGNDKHGERCNENYEYMSDEEIWTEEQWEEHFVENEKLMDIYERVHRENPDRDWRHPYDLYCKVHYGIDLGRDFSFADLKEEGISPEPDNDQYDKGDNNSVLIDRYESERKTYPILDESYEYSKAVIEFVKGLEGAKDVQKDLSKYVSAALQIGAKLYGAHAMGYEKDALEGNIAACKIALRKSNDAIYALAEMKPRIGELISFAKIDEKLQQLKMHVEEWIAELRGRVWWR